MENHYVNSWHPLAEAIAFLWYRLKSGISMSDGSERRRRIAMIGMLFSSLSIWPATATGSGYETQFIVNGIRLTYDLRPIAGDCEIFDRASVTLGEGEHMIPFKCRRDKIFLADIPRVTFSGNVRPIRNQTVTLDTLRFESRPGGPKKGLFSPLYKVFASEFKMIKGQRWFVSTQFENPDKKGPANRTYWIIKHGLLVTLNATILPHEPVSREWRDKRFQQLEEIVSRVTISK